MRFSEAVDYFYAQWQHFYANEGIAVPTPPFLLGPPGIGKCLGKGTPVLMFDGTTKPVEDIVDGDRIMGPDGEVRTVAGTTSGRAPMYKIVPIKGDPWICNNVHILTLVSTDTGKIVDIPLNDYLGDGTSNTFRERHKQFFVEVEHFEGEQSIGDDEVSPYFLGLWLGDGTKSFTTVAGEEVLATVHVTKEDPTIVAALNEVARKWNVQLKDVSSENRCATWSFTTPRGEENPLLNAMREAIQPGVRVHHKYRVAPPAQRLELLAGLLDTDGSLTSGTFEITQKNKEISNLIVFLCRSVGLQATQKEKIVDNESYWRVHISGDLDMIPTRVPHKKATPRKQIKDVTRTGFTVEALGEGEYYGFTVDKDGRFLLGDFTVTHNTAIGKDLSRRMQKFYDERGEDKEVSYLALDLSSMLPEDLGGIPLPSEKNGKAVTNFAVQGKLEPFTREGAVGVLILDDITQAAPSVQVAARQTVLFRVLGDYKLSPGVFLIITGNRQGDASAATQMPAHFRNSTMLIEMKPHLEDWMEWYLENGYPPVIAAFLRYRSVLFSQLPKEADTVGAFATPRTWHKLAMDYPIAEKTGNVALSAKGLVGEGPGIEFQAFVNLRNEVIDPERILQDPERTIPDLASAFSKADRTYATLSRFAEYAQTKALETKAPREKADVLRRFARAIGYIGTVKGDFMAATMEQFLGGHKELSQPLLNTMMDPRNKQDPYIASLLGFFHKVSKRNK